MGFLWFGKKQAKKQIKSSIPVKPSSPSVPKTNPPKVDMTTEKAQLLAKALSDYMKE